jgi:Fe-S oxidoreductase
MMYQLVPYIERLVALEHRVEGWSGGSALGRRLGPARLARLSRLARRANRHLSGVGLVAPAASAKGEHERVPANAALLLRHAGVSFGYLYEDDLYAGALAHDLGADKTVADHAERVAANFAKWGVREAITIDPHTTDMLRNVYPHLVPGFDVSVRSYLEVLAEVAPTPPAPGTPQAAGQRQVVVHRSCMYERPEGAIDPSRALLQAAGLSVREPELPPGATSCCGGLAEAFHSPLHSPRPAGAGTSHFAQPAGSTTECVTMCPMCLVNLRKASGGLARFRDISDYLVEALGPTAQPFPAPSGP